jgi:uncharacterized membrane protein YfcA
VVRKLILVGGLAGFLSGLLGIGGGVIIVPAMVFLMGYSQKEAQGTSVLIMFFLGIIGVLAYSIFSVKLDFHIVSILTAGGFIGALAGSMLAQKMDTSSLKKVFALYICYAGIRIFLI